ncbi:MAG: hypothetical protein ACYDC6_02150 [Acidobacteriaceae bacterium]
MEHSGCSGNIYIADTFNDRVLKEDMADAPSLTFPTPTTVGATDASDGPQSVTVENIDWRAAGVRGWWSGGTCSREENPGGRLEAHDCGKHTAGGRGRAVQLHWMEQWRQRFHGYDRCPIDGNDLHSELQHVVSADGFYNDRRDRDSCSGTILCASTTITMTGRRQ